MKDNIISSRFRIGSLLGRGGFGSVFEGINKIKLGMDLKTGAKVAIKIVCYCVHIGI